ncbi:MAG: hypothetical protein U1E59_18400 [Amaricoccus sp.]
MVRGLAGQLRRRSSHPVVAAEPNAAAAAAQTPAAIAAWKDLEARFDPGCIGIIVEPGPAATVAAAILVEGCRGGPMPGAIALVGYAAEFLATCLQLAPACERGLDPGGDAQRRRPASTIELPPMMIFMPSDDPAIAACAHACRRLRAAGIATGLEIVGAVRERPSDIAAVATELAGEIEAFFDANLIHYLPRHL